MVIVSLYCMIVSLLANTFVWLIAGGAWAKPLTALSITGVIAVCAAVLVALVFYFVIALSIVYALPRAFLRGKPLFPEVGRSLRAGMHYRFALLTVLAVLFGPVVLAAIVSLNSIWLAYLALSLANTLVLPLVACSLYCSYRTIFPPPSPTATGARPR